VEEDLEKFRERLRALGLNSRTASLEGLAELARLTREEGWPPERVRAALEELHLEARDETDKPAA
jgi:hypothetical protein